MPAIIAALLPAAQVIAAGAQPATGTLPDVAFDQAAPLADSAQLLRRMMSPLQALRIEEPLQRQGKRAGGQPLDPARERFIVHAPAVAPADGYALLVFVPPWPQARLPHGWAAVLDRHRMIYVSAADSGNDADPINRREPLALLAAYNVMRRWHVDPRRVYVGGFSGGARVALRLALAYPDVFRGALLDAGSDPVGSAEIPLPPADLFHAFQQSSRIVFLTGADDTANLDFARRSQASLRGWCVFDLDDETVRSGGHDPADPFALNHALLELEQPDPGDAGRLAQCRAKIGQELDAQLQHAQSLADGGRRDDALELLQRIDARYGGLAAPQSVELMQRIEAQR